MWNAGRRKILYLTLVKKYPSLSKRRSTVVVPAPLVPTSDVESPPKNLQTRKLLIATPGYKPSLRDYRKRLTVSKESGREIYYKPCKGKSDITPVPWLRIVFITYYCNTPNKFCLMNHPSFFHEFKFCGFREAP